MHHLGYFNTICVYAQYLNMYQIVYVFVQLNIIIAVLVQYTLLQYKGKRK